LYSAVNFRRARFSKWTPRGIFASPRVSTKPGQVQHRLRTVRERWRALRLRGWCPEGEPSVLL